MNQEQNNLNQNNFNIQGNNGIPNNQPLNNQGFNSTFNQNVGQDQNVSRSIFNPQSPVEPISPVQPQPTPSFQQPLMQEPTLRTVNSVDSEISNSTITESTTIDLNKKVNKKQKNILIIIIIGIILIILSIITIFIFKSSNKSPEFILKNAKYEYKTFLYGTEYHEYFNSVVGTKDNGFVAVGISEVNNGFKSRANIEYQDAVIVKYNSSNQVEWETFYSSEEKDLTDIFTDIKLTDSNEYIVAAKINGKENRGNIYYDAAILKYNDKGKLLWKKVLEGDRVDVYEKVYVLSSGEILAVGYSTSSDLNNIKNSGNKDAIISKYDKSGNLLWIKNYGRQYNDIFYSVIELSDGSIIAVGESSQDHFNGLFDAIIIKYDKNGNLLWEKNFGGSDFDDFKDVVLTKTNEIIAVGSTISKDIKDVDFNGSALAVKYDLDGNYKNVYTFGGEFLSSFECIISYNDKYLLSGYTGLPNKSDTESIFIELDDNLNMLSEKIINGNHDDYIYGIATMKDTGFVAVGDSGSDFEELKHAGLGDGIIIRKQNINY